MRAGVFLLFCSALLAGCGSNPNEPAAPCTFALSSTSLTVTAQGGAGSVNVSTGSQCSWVARADNPWIAVSSGASGTGPATVAFTVAANGDTEPRSCSLTIAGLAFSVSQQGQTPCSYALAPTTRTFEAAGGTGAIDVSAPAHCGWTATSGAAWLAVTGGAQGTGNGTVTYSVEPNLDAHGVARTTGVTIGEAVHLVVQTGPAGCPVTLSPDDETFSAGGGSGSFAVNGPSGCTWIARSGVGWIHVTAPPGGLGEGSQRVSYTVDANTAADARTGTLTVGSQAFVVTQAGTRACEYVVSPLVFTECLRGGFERTITVATQTACGWTATTSAPWLTIASGQSGNGPGTITFTFTSNMSAARDGLVMVRWPTPTQGQNVRVAQAGCLYAFNPATVDIAVAGGVSFFEVFSTPTDPMCGGPLQDACVWRAESTVPWITVTTTTWQRGDNRVYFSVSANNSGATRVATIVVGDRVVTVRQAGS